MCALHPDGQNTAIYELDFNRPDVIRRQLASEGRFDLVISASALQWATDLRHTLEGLRPLGRHFALAVLTADTFDELHTKAGTKSPLPQRESIERLIQATLGLSTCIERYALDFDTPKALLDYVRSSGVTGFHHGLGYRAAKALLEDVTLTTLSFEVVMAVGQPLAR
jgi:malonyl-CoA O-methyltransferase